MREKPQFSFFEEDVVKAEIRCLLQEILRRAGFQASDTSQTNVLTDSVTIDSDAAMSAARKVSSAYLDLFKSQESSTSSVSASRHVE